MKKIGVFVLAFGLLFLSCGKFTVSPYVSSTPNSRLNQHQLQDIKSLEPTSSDTFKIVALSDTHNYYNEFSDQIDYINSKSGEYKFVIISGDLTNLGLLREFETTKKLLKKLRIPYVTAVGNHDLLSNGASIYRQMFGLTDYSFTFRQTKFIFFNNNNWESSGIVPNLSFVESELASSTSTNHVLVAHVSPQDKDRWNQEEKDDMQAIVDTYGVNYFLNGHDHNPGANTFGVATRVTVGASNKGKILELEISNAGVTHQFIDF